MNLKKVAELAHMSVSTVSRALNDSFDVAPETREYILKIAEESGYFNQKKHIKQGTCPRGDTLPRNNKPLLFGDSGKNHFRTARPRCKRHSVQLQF